MEKKKKGRSVWGSMLQGVLVSMSIYLIGQMVCAALLLNGTLGEGRGFPVIAVLCTLAAMFGGLAAKDSSLNGAAGPLLFSGILVVLIAAVGLLCWREITWSGHGGVLMLCVLGGGILAGCFRGRGKAAKRHRR